MIKKTIQVGEREVTFAASAMIPRIYRCMFGRDVFVDMNKALKKIDGSAEFELEDLTAFENIAYLMARHADKNVPESVEEWLDQFDTFSIYEILPEIVSLWGMNMQADAESKKKYVPPNGK